MGSFSSVTSGRPRELLQRAMAGAHGLDVPLVHGAARLPAGEHLVPRDLATVEVPVLVGPLEGALTQAAQQHVLAVAHDDEVGDRIGVDIERVRAGDRIQVRGVAPGSIESQRPTRLAAVAEECGRIGAPGGWIAPFWLVRHSGVAAAVSVSSSAAPHDIVSELRPLVIESRLLPTPSMMPLTYSGPCWTSRISWMKSEPVQPVASSDSIAEGALLYPPVEPGSPTNLANPVRFQFVGQNRPFSTSRGKPLDWR